MCQSKRRCLKAMVSQWNERDWEATTSESQAESSREPAADDASVRFACTCHG
jgi:hypothetical protein